MRRGIRPVGVEVRVGQRGTQIRDDRARGRLESIQLLAAMLGVGSHSGRVGCGGMSTWGMAVNEQRSVSGKRQTGGASSAQQGGQKASADGNLPGVEGAKGQGADSHRQLNADHEP